MPSPIGHGLAAVAASWAVVGPSAPRRALWKQSAICAAIGVAPDLDLLFGSHRGASHSLTAAVLVASVAAIARVPIAATRTRVWLAACAAWSTHPLLDMLGLDTSAPFGVMTLWPFSTAHYHTGLAIFDSISRRWWLAGFLAHNAMAAMREIAILLPLVAIVWWARARAARRRQIQ